MLFEDLILIVITLQVLLFSSVTVHFQHCTMSNIHESMKSCSFHDGSTYL